MIEIQREVKPKHSSSWKPLRRQTTPWTTRQSQSCPTSTLIIWPRPWLSTASRIRAAKAFLPKGREQSHETIRSEINKIMSRASGTKAGLQTWQPPSPPKPAKKDQKGRKKASKEKQDEPVDLFARLEPFQPLLVSCLE